MECRLFIPLLIVIWTASFGTTAAQIWERQSPWPTDNHLLGVDFVTADEGWICGGVAGNGEIWRTTDGGSSWNRQFFDEFETLNDIDMWNTSMGIAVGDEFLYRTNDGGQNWIAQPYAQGVSGTQIQLVSETAGFMSVRAAGATNFLYSTSDGGANWVFIGEFYVGEWKFADENVGWAVDLDNQFVRTSDGGTTWQIVDVPAANSAGSVANVFSYDEAVITTFNSSDRFVVHHTSDGGQTWQSSGSEAGGRYQRFADSEHGWGFEFGKIFRTSDGGSSWHQQHSGIPAIKEIHVLTSSIAIAVGEWGYLIATDDGGSNWYQVANGSGRELTSISMADELNGWAVGDAGVILHTTDGGQFWEIQETNLNDPFSCPEFLTIWARSPTYAVAYCGAGFVATEDAGVTWQLLDWPHVSTFQLLDFVDADRIAILDGISTLYWSNDGGQSWDARSAQGFDLRFNEFLYELEMFDDTTGWVVGRYNQVYQTTDGGNNWIKKQLPQGESNVFRHVQFANPNEGWIAANFGTIMHTTNGGQTWQDKSIPNFQENVQDILVDGGTIYVVGGYGGGQGGLGWLRKSTDGGNSWPFVYNHVRGIQQSITKVGDRIWTAGVAGMIYHWGMPVDEALHESFEVETGDHVAGSLLDLETADDNYLQFSSPPSRSLPTDAIFAYATTRIQSSTSISDPVRMMIDVESSISTLAGAEIVRLMNWSTGQWETVSNSSVSQQDQVRRIAIDSPADLVGPNGEIEIEVGYRVIRRFSLIKFTAKVDQLRILVE